MTSFPDDSGIHVCRDVGRLSGVSSTRRDCCNPCKPNGKSESEFVNEDYSFLKVHLSVNDIG